MYVAVVVAGMEFVEVYSIGYFDFVELVEVSTALHWVVEPVVVVDVLVEPVVVVDVVVEPVVEAVVVVVVVVFAVQVSLEPHLSHPNPQKEKDKLVLQNCKKGHRRKNKE